MNVQARAAEIAAEVCRQTDPGAIRWHQPRRDPHSLSRVDACPVCGDGACENLQHVPPPPLKPTAPASSMTLLSMAQVKSRPAPNWRIYKLLTGFSLLWAAPGSFKTFLAVAWAVAVASGSRWFGRRVAQGPVVYVVAEGNVRAFYNRVVVAGEALGVRDPETLPLFVVPGAVDLSAFDSIQAQQLRAAVLAKVAEAGGIGLLVVDTLARCLPGDENTQEAMGGFVRTLDVLRADLGCDVLVVHHSSASGERERGSTVLAGAVDVNLQLKRLGPPVNGRVPLGLYAMKMKDAESGGTEPLVRMESVRVSVYQDGQPVLDEERNEVTTCRLAEVVVESSEQTPAADVHGLAFDWIKSNPGASGNRVCDGIKRIRKTTFAALRDLEAQGRITRRGAGWVAAGDPVTKR